ncbi:MAG: long-chain fatty acid--CoA ligase [Kofleriaceae bacterium]
MATSTAPEPFTRTTSSIPALFLDRVSTSPDREAYRYPVGEQWRSITWKTAGDRVTAIAAGLLALGLEREQRVGILSGTRYEWVLVDLGVLCAGGATTTVYPSSTAEECAYILHDSASQLVFAEDSGQVAKLRGERAAMPALSKVVLLDGAVDAADGDWVMTLADLEALGATHLAAHPTAVTAAVAGVEAEHLATLIYTSGTTGKPKGVRLVHDCWAYTADAIAATGLVNDADLEYLWLPMSHSFGKVLTSGHIKTGHTLAIDGRIPKLIDNLAVVRPTMMAAAPRIFEKVYNKVVQGAKDGGGMKWRIFQWAIGVGREVSALKQRGEAPGAVLGLKNKLATKLVFSKLQDRFGGRLRLFVSGSAPLSREIAEFFHAAGVLIVEGYGLTESSAASFVNRPTRFRFGTVGLPMPGTQVKLAPEDGEILIKSPGVMRGYHNLPDETAATLTSDHWLRTGDIGEIDADGFLRITDRKKDLIKTSGGKYVAPQHIEGKVKATCPFVSQVIVHGDRRNFCSALVTLDEEAITKWAAGAGLAGKSYAQIVASSEAKALVQTYIDQVNRDLAKWETIKKFAILPSDLTVEAGELTPSLKVKRKAVEKKYSPVLDEMYQGAMADV